MGDGGQMTYPVGECYLRQQGDGTWSVFGISHHAQLNEYPMSDGWATRLQAEAWADGYTQGASENR